MDLPDSTTTLASILGHLGESFVEHILLVFWGWLFLQIAALVKLADAKRRGMPEPVINQWQGASIAIGVMVIFTGLLLWALPAFLAGLAVAAFVIIGKATWHHFARERERLRRAGSGLFEYKREMEKVQVLLFMTMDKVNLERNRLAETTIQARQRLGTHPQRAESTTKTFARALRRSSDRIRRYSLRQKVYTTRFFDAIAGIHTLSGEVLAPEQLAGMKAACERLIKTSNEWIETMRGVASLSSELIAAKNELAESIVLVIEATQVAIDFCDRGLQAAPVKPPSPPSAP